jgi:hypothetical protein
VVVRGVIDMIRQESNFQVEPVRVGVWGGDRLWMQVRWE